MLHKEFGKKFWFLLVAQIVFTGLKAQKDLPQNYVS